MSAKAHLLPRGRNERRDLYFVWIIAFLPLVQFAIFYLGINFNSIVYAFKAYSNNQGELTASTWYWCGFDNFAQLFHEFGTDSVYKTGLINGLISFAISTPILVILSLLFSYFIYLHQNWLGTFMKMMLFLPTVIPPIALSTVYSKMVDQAFPLIMHDLFGVQVKGLLENTDLTLYTLIFYGIWVGFGGNVVLLSQAMSQIPMAELEAAEIDGAGYFRRFWNVIVPGVFPTVKSLMLISIGGFFANQMNLVNFYGLYAPERIQTLGYAMYVDTVLTTQQPSTAAQLPKLSALGLIFTAITVPIVYLVKYLMDHFGPSED